MQNVFNIIVDCIDQPYMKPWEKNFYTAAGSGFCIVIAEKKYILTAYHVIDRAKIVRVNFIETKILFTSKLLDLALLECPSELDAKPLYMGTMKPGDEIEALGFPIYGDMLSRTRGIVSRLFKFKRKLISTLAYHIDATVNPGNSGGPITNSNGQYVGILIAKHIATEGMAIVIPFFTIKYFLSRFAEGSMYFILPDFTWQYRDDYMNIPEPVVITHASKFTPIDTIEDIPIAADGTIAFGDFLRYCGFEIYDDQRIPFHFIIAHARDKHITMRSSQSKHTLSQYKIVKRIFDFGEPTSYIFGDFIFAPVTRGLMSEIERYVPYIGESPRTIILVSYNKRYVNKILDIAYDQLCEKLSNAKMTDLVVPFYEREWNLNLRKDQKKNNRLHRIFDI